MFALLACIMFAVVFILHLVGTSTGHIDLTVLGLAFLALHFVLGTAWAVPRFGRRE